MGHHQVAIIGRGITGLSTAWHLMQSGIQDIVIVGPQRVASNCTSINPGYGSITPHDNVTRLLHRHGSETLQSLLTINRVGFVGLLNFAKLVHEPVQIGETRRITSTIHEQSEMKKAVAWLEKNGFPANLSSTANSSINDSKTHELLLGNVCQRDGAASGSFHIKSFLDKLEYAVGAKIKTAIVTQIDSSPESIQLDLDDEGSLTCEMVVVAAHSSIPKLLPTMTECLVTHADQWSEFEILFDASDGFVVKPSSLLSDLSPGNFYLLDHSQFWMTVQSPRKIAVGGARYLRKWGGLEATAASVDERCTKAYQQKIEQVFQVKLSEPISTSASLELRACDELPLIGPVAGDDRILMAGGYMGTGLTTGFAAGMGLAQLIKHGRSTLIPTFFHPKRLRSGVE